MKVEPVFRDHLREVIKVVSYIRFGFYKVDLRRVVLSGERFLTAVDYLIQVVSNPGLIVFADDKLNFAQNIKFVSRRIKNISAEKRKWWFQLFLLFPQYLKRLFSSEALKVVGVC